MSEAAAETGRSAGPEPSPAPGGSGKPDSTVLIVDDEPAGREVLHALLLDQGYNLALASNGLDALAKASELTPDLIILDVMMPAMNGYEVCQRLRAHPTLAQVPVIMVTALDDRGSRLRGIEAGADDFVSKPFDRLELRTRVKTIMRLNRFRRLLSEHARFEWVVENAADGYLIVDRCDRILYANSLARRYLDLPEQGNLSTAETLRAHAERRYRVTPEESWRSGTPVDAGKGGSPVYLVRPESEGEHSLWLRVEAFSMAAHAGEGVLVRLRDVTSAVVMQRDSWTYHALIRHKLATPVTKLNLALSLLVDPKGTEEADRRALFTMAQGSARELGEEIERIFEYTAALDQRGGGPKGSSVADLECAVGEISESLKITAPTVHYVGVAWFGETRLALSEHALEMILWEVLENSKKFHPEQKPAVEIEIAALEDGIHISIADNGRSVSPEVLDKVWLPYFQAERYFTGQVPGMGLGLSAVATLVWSVGGSCRLRNRDDLPGVVVELVIPSAPVASQGRAGSS